MLLGAGVDLGDINIAKLVDAGVTTVKVRSVLTCESASGAAVCRTLAGQRLVDVGEAVGIVAAQSIGEPGTQLTMRTFHTGGVIGDDITQGLPRVQALRGSSAEGQGADLGGCRPGADRGLGSAAEDRGDAGRRVGGDRLRGQPPGPAAGGRRRSRGRGPATHCGYTDPHDVLRVLGVRRVQEHLVDEVQSVCRTQGAPIHDKHIEIIIRQMLRRVTVIESGDSELLAGDLVDRLMYEAEPQGGCRGSTPASGRAVLMGITKASLATESWLSAASFQETTKVLTDAAIQGKSDSLVGLKENVILGKLIPAGTGLDRYRNIRVEPTEGARRRRTRWWGTTRSATTSVPGLARRYRWRSSTSATIAESGAQGGSEAALGVGQVGARPLLVPASASGRTQVVLLSRCRNIGSPRQPIWASRTTPYGAGSSRAPCAPVPPAGQSSTALSWPSTPGDATAPTLGSPVAGAKPVHRPGHWVLKDAVMAQVDLQCGPFPVVSLMSAEAAAS